MSRVFVSRVQVFSPAGTVLSLIETPQSDPALASGPENISYPVRHTKRKLVRRLVSWAYPTIQTAHYYTVFPLYNPASPGVLVLWEMPSQQRSRHVPVAGLTLGTGRGSFGGIIGEAESAKVKRSMYAETQTEKVWVTRDER